MIPVGYYVSERGIYMFEKLEKFQIAILGLLLACGIVFAAKSVTASVSKDGISVTGSAFEVVKSDSGRLEFEITAKQPTKIAGYNVVKKQLPEVMAFLKSKGIKDENIEVKAYSGYYSYKYNNNGNSTNEIDKYNLSLPVVITSTDVNTIKDISTDIQNLLDKGIDINVYRPEYYYSNLAELKVKLLQEATKDAKQRASAMLKATNNKAGKIQSVKMGVFQITPVDSTNVSDMGISDTSTIDKKITSVANVVFQIK